MVELLAVAGSVLLIFSCSSSRSLSVKKSIKTYDSTYVAAMQDSITKSYIPKEVEGLLTGIESPDTIMLQSDSLLISDMQVDSLAIDDDIIDEEEELSVWGNSVEFSGKEVTNVGFANYDIFDGTNKVRISLDEIASKATYPFAGILSSTYGVRRGRMHSGIDISARNGATHILAAMDGVVRLSLYMRYYGNLIVIRHSNGLETLYAHNKENFVKRGDIVHSGDTIAIVGRTGRATGPHLHFEFRVMGKAIDPNLFLNPKESAFLSGDLFLHKFSSNIIASRQEDRSKIVIHRYHKVRSGDTLWGLSRKYGVTLKQLCSLNKVTTKTVLRIGQQLQVS